jgi:hypothetical protein
MILNFSDALGKLLRDLSGMSTFEIQHWICQCADQKQIARMPPISEPSYYELFNQIITLAASAPRELHIRISDALCCAISDWNPKHGSQRLAELALIADSLQISAVIQTLAEKFFLLPFDKAEDEGAIRRILTALQGFPPGHRLQSFGERLLSSPDYSNHHLVAAILVCEGSPDRIASVFNLYYARFTSLQFDAKAFYYRFLEAGLFANIASALPTLAPDICRFVAADLFDTSSDPWFRFHSVSEQQRPINRDVRPGHYLKPAESTINIFGIHPKTLFQIPISLDDPTGCFQILNSVSTEKHTMQPASSSFLRVAAGRDR